KTLVILAGEPLEMAPQGHQVLFQGLLAGNLVYRHYILLVSIETDLGVDYHLPVPWQTDQNVRLESFPAAALQADLSLILPPLFQPGVLQYPLQHQLAPVALGLLPLQRPSQVGRLVAQALIELLQS